MSYGDFFKTIKGNNNKNIILLYGEENYLLDKAITVLKETICPMMPDLNYTLFEGNDVKLDEVSATCEVFPLMDKKRLVLMKNNSKADADQYVKLLKNMSEDTIFVWAVYGTIDKRSKTYKEFEKNGSVFEMARISKEELSKWISNLMKKEGKTIENKTLFNFVQITGYTDKNTELDLYHVENEVNKLIAYVGDGDCITNEDVMILTTKSVEHDIFKLINACQEKNTEASLKAFQELMFWGESPMGILSMLSKNIRTMYYAKEVTAKGLGYKDLAKELKIHEFVAKQCVNYSSKLEQKNIKGALERCIIAEMEFKSGKKSEKLAMELLISQLFI